MSDSELTEKSYLLEDRSVERSDGREKKKIRVTTSKATTVSVSRKIVVMVACFYLNAVAFGLATCLGVVYVDLIDAFEAPRAQAALVQSIYMGLMIGGGVFFTELIGKHGPGVYTILGSLLATVGMVLGSQATNIVFVIVSVGGLCGFGMCVYLLGGFIAVSQIFGENRKLALGVLTIASTLGQSTFPFISDFLLQEYGWRGTLMIMGALIFQGSACGLVLHTSKQYFENKADSLKKEQTNIRRCNYFNMLADYKLLLLTFFGLIWATTGPVEQWFMVDLAILRGYSRQTGSLLLTVLGLTGFIGRLFGIVLLGCFRKYSSVWHVIYGFLLFGVGHFLVIWLTDIAGMVCGTTIRGLGAGIIVAMQPSLQLEMRGLELYSQTVAVYNLAIGVGQVAGGFIGGTIADVSGGYDLMFYIATAGSVVAAVIAFILWFFGLRKVQPNVSITKKDYSTLEESNTV